MNEPEWITCQDSHRLVESLRSASTRKLSLFACAVCRTVWDQMSDFQRQGIQIAEAFADGTHEGELRDKHLQRLEHINDKRSREMKYLTSALWGGWYAASRNAGFGIDMLREVAFVRCIFGNPFRPVTFLPEWRTSNVIALARQMYESRDFAAMPILADALMDTGCSDEVILTHCRGPGPHVRGCWCVDLVLGKEQS